MGRYDSPLSVATLFLAATVVSVGLIFLFDAETERRHPNKVLPPAQLSQDNEIQELHHEQELQSSAEKERLLSQKIVQSTEESAPYTNILGFFEYKLKNLFKRRHTRAKRSLSEDSEEDDYDGKIEEPYALPLVDPRPSKNVFSKREASEDNSRSSHHYEVKASFIPSPPPPSSSGFHKVRHAMKKLGGGGLDLSMVERILDSNPGRFRGNSGEVKESEQQQHRKSYNSYNSPKRAQVEPDFDIFSLPASLEGRKDNGNSKESFLPTTAPDPLKSFGKEGMTVGAEKGNKGGEWERSGKQREKITPDNNLLSQSSPSPGKSSKASVLNGGSTVINPSVDSKQERRVDEKAHVNWESAGFDVEAHSRTEGDSRPGHSRGEDLESPNVVHQHVRPPTKEDVPICYKTDDVLIVVAITCCLNFAFVLAVWGCVRWFSISSTSKERDFQQLDCEDGGESIIFQEEQDHEDCCWRPASPLEFEGDVKFYPRREDCLEVSNLHCRHSHRMRPNIPSGGVMLTDSSSCKNISPPLLFIPSLLNHEDFIMNGTTQHNIVNSLRKPKDRFHFFRQKQYQKNLKEFGLGFVGPPTTFPEKVPPRTSSSLYSFQPSNVPQPSPQSSRSSSLQKFYSHSMEDLRYIHT